MRVRGKSLPFFFLKILLLLDVKLLLKPHAGVTVVVAKKENPCSLEACPFLSSECSGEASSLFITCRTIILFHGTVCTVFSVLFTYG